jgi:2,4-dienoyl-CoA reductase-like NADH-dependent reductase (Old Yellow Enzyme family)
VSSLLFSPYKMRGLELSNRIVVSPMCQYAAVDGSATDWHIMHLGSFAVSGPGLVITEATGVEPEGRISPDCLGLYSDANEAAMARVLAFFRAYGQGTKFGVQLAHAGRKGSVPPSFKIRTALTPDNGGWIPPSPSYYEDGIHTPPRVMTLDDIAKVRANWAASTARAARIGVDLIELHFAHGYLVNEFLSPLINQRTDQYGGSRENRMRFALEIFEVCRAAFPEDRPIGVRVSAVDWVEGGWDMDDTIALGHELKARGCDYLCLTSGGVSLKQKIQAGPNYQVPFAERVKKETGMTAMAVGQITEAQQAETILQEGRADLVAIARKMLHDPRWAWHAAEALGEHVSYAPRYLTANPKIGGALKFAEDPEKGKQLQALWEEEAKYRATLKAS